MPPTRIERTTRLASDAPTVWRHATSMDGINAELAPLSMSHPPDLDALPDDPPLGTPLFTSTLRVGPLPFDRHRLTLVHLEPGRSFEEGSTSWLHRRWRHTRRIDPIEGGCEVTDRVEVVPRAVGTGPVVRLLVGWVFDRRHRVLAARFGRH